MTSNSFAGREEVGGGHDRASRLNTISEAMDSTGKCSGSLLCHISLYVHAFKPADLNASFIHIYNIGI
jgi:hypothetical protein